MLARFFRHMLKPRIAVPVIILAVSTIELLVADRKYGVFSGGFGQSQAVDSSGELAVFLIGYGLSQLAAALLAWFVAKWIARGRNAYSAVVHFAFLYGGLSLIALNLQYQLHSYFSDAVSFALLKQLGGGSATDALLFAKNEIALGLVAIAIFLMVWLLTARLVRRLQKDGQQASGARQWPLRGAILIAFLAAIFLIPHVGGDANKGLGRMLVWQGASTALAVATDFDGDGYGLAGRRIDSHPFDGARHPLALDIPGNGIDEDGYGGDLMLEPVPEPLPMRQVSGDRPHVIIVILESTRWDVIGKRIDGKSVAPNLEAVVAQGGAIVPSFSHIGFTTGSLKSIFGGAIAVAPEAPSLFREFKQSGYDISVFSGQPEDFGGISETVGMREAADNFVDAEKLKDQRAFSFAAQGSLLIDEEIVLGEFDKALGSAQSWEQPQFVYLNFQSPHFPYHHPGVPERFAHPPLERGEINAANAEQVQRTYWNAVAHADAALGELIAKLKQLGVWENTVMLVSGDHGEALFESGFLGHGHMIDRLQYGTFLASNRELGDVSAPIAISDYRRILHAMLGTELPETASFAPFMHVGTLDEPAAIGVAHATHGIVSLRFDRDEACFEKSGECTSYGALSGERLEAVNALVARWGSERWAARQRDAASGAD